MSRWSRRPKASFCGAGSPATARPIRWSGTGIEAFFAPKEKALKLEKDLRNGGTAILMVARSGNAALKDVIPNPGPRPDLDSERE